MPRVIDLPPDDRVLEVEECAAAIAKSRFDPQCLRSVEETAGHLRALGANRTFLGDRLVALLLDEGAGECCDSIYTPQSIMLTAPHDGFFLRANIWPAERDSCFRRSGGHSFAYGAAHDHNFDFLTFGYFGPGYRSDYFEYDYVKIAGYRGEPAGLRFVERSTLSPGKMMHYRAHRDVHAQLPPESLSISLNVMACDPAQAWCDQYGFDLTDGTVRKVLNTGSTEVLLRIAVALRHEEGMALASEWGRSHASDRIRLASFDALAAAAKDTRSRDGIWRRAELSGSLLVAREATHRRRGMG